ncbi:MAG TPA: M28 family peptidase [Gemmatimonadaceae bacterium]
MSTCAGTTRRHLEVIAAEPRPAGSAAEAAARRHCVAELASLGFTVMEESFEYSAFPGRFGTPAAGAVSILVLATVGHLGFHGAPAAALALLVAAGLALAVLAQWGARRGVLSLPWARATGVNLVATRGNHAPRMWLVAHLDSKSQPIPILVRALGVTVSIALWVVAAALLVAQLTGAHVAALWPWISLAGVVAGAPVAASIVQSRSHGALDNASGTATVLVAAGMLPRECELGVLVTSAEELGLAGARAWARARSAGTAINCDGIDDCGGLRLTFTGARPGSLVDALVEAAAARGEPAVVRRLPPGVLVDGVALADAGWDVVTVSRGTVRTVACIHTPGDNLDAVQGHGVECAAAVIARAVAALA